MSKERLERIKERVNYHGHLNDEVEWLIEQAERVQELEEDKKALGDLIEETAKIAWNVEQQNKRYREALEFYAERGNYTTNIVDDDFNYHQAVFFDNGKKARKALEGEE